MARMPLVLLSPPALARLLVLLGRREVVEIGSTSQGKLMQVECVIGGVSDILAQSRGHFVHLSPHSWQSLQWLTSNVATLMSDPNSNSRGPATPLRTTVINALAPHAGACSDPATSATAQQTNQPLPIIATTLL
jgi:hypothetical protein